MMAEVWQIRKLVVMSRITELQNKIPDWMKSDFFLNLLTLFLWVVSAAFSFYVVLEFQQMILRRFSAWQPDERWGFQAVRQWTSIFVIGIWIGFTVITGEYHYQHLRSPASWKVFKWSFVGLLVALAIALIL